MPIEIISNQKTSFRADKPTSVLLDILGLLPKAMALEIETLEKKGNKIEEIRLRSLSVSTVTSANKNLRLSHRVTENELQKIMVALCGGSPYAYSETIKKGYITLDGGVRIGVCGRASIEGDRIIGIRDVSGLNIRIPRAHLMVGEFVSEKLRQICLSGGGGVLIYSPPGEGKTTLLKGVISFLASGNLPLRILVVDTRDELFMLPSKQELCVDILSGYPKAEGIEIATRTMNAQLIVCDEIGTPKDVEAILFAQNCGVPLLATAHASNIDGLMRRTGIAKLHRACVFDLYIGIKRISGNNEYEYTVTDREEADKHCGI